MTRSVRSLNLYNPGGHIPPTPNLRKRKHSPHRPQQVPVALNNRSGTHHSGRRSFTRHVEGTPEKLTPDQLRTTYGRGYSIMIQEGYEGEGALRRGSIPTPIKPYEETYRGAGIGNHNTPALNKYAKKYCKMESKPFSFVPETKRSKSHPAAIT